MNKNAFAITLEVALVTGELVRVMCVLHVKLKMAPVIKLDAALVIGDRFRHWVYCIYV